MEVTAGAMIPLLNKLGELLRDELNLEKRVKKGIRSLLTELELMRATLLKVGEVPPDQLDMEVRIWAGKVKDLSYDMEDVVNGFMVRVEEGHDSEPTNLKNKVKKLLKKTTRLFTKGKALHQISSAIQEARDLAKELAEQHNRYKLEMPTTGLGANIDPRLIDMYKDVTQLVGVEEARDELIQRMTEGDEGSKLQLKTISIVGFGGLGKTTLARAVYDKIKVDFNCGAFVSVSRNTDLKKLLKDMLYGLDEVKFKDIHNTTRDEMLLRDELRKFLEGKRFLIIIDDIWDEIAWRFIKCALPKNSLDSQVITTTRIVSVAQACRSSNHHMIHTMKPLSDKDSERLFHRRIFHSETGCPDQLQEVSRDILKKCGGVPLAIIAIASLLDSNHGTKTKDQWCHLLKSIGRGLAEGGGVEDMKRILSYSYYDLPSHLKACLLYLSIFPEDYMIERERLIWRWIAEGFIHPKKQETSLFKLGESYFNELVNRSMIMPVDIDYEDKACACRVHDMVLDLICSLSREENFVTILDGIGRSTYDSQSKVRRLSLQNNSMTEPNTPRLGTMSMSQVRSVSLFMPGVNLMPSLSWFEFLRVLDLEYCKLGERQDKIDLRYLGNLLHLRYLGLKSTGINYLPSEIGKLQFLQTLDVRDNLLEELPSSVSRLRQLMCLCIECGTKVQVAGLGNLVSLEELGFLLVQHFSQDYFEELSKLTKLRVLQICLEQKLSESQHEALTDAIGNMHKLQSLRVSGMTGVINFILKCINPSLLPLLSYLEIYVFEARWEDIQVLGKLPALRCLDLDNGSMDEPVVEKGFVVTADAFPCLRYCRFAGFVMAPSMFPQGAMPMLRHFWFALRVCDIISGGLDLGMGHLPSLESITVELIYCLEESHGTFEEAEALVRQAADAHPNHPTLEIYRSFSRRKKKRNISIFV